VRRLRLACPYGQEALSHQARPSGEAPYDADSIESSDDICQDQLAYIQLTHIDIGKKGSQIVELQKTNSCATAVRCGRHPLFPRAGFKQLEPRAAQKHDHSGRHDPCRFVQSSSTHLTAPS